MVDFNVTVNMSPEYFLCSLSGQYWAHFSLNYYNVIFSFVLWYNYLFYFAHLHTSGQCDNALNLVLPYHPPEIIGRLFCWSYINIIVVVTLFVNVSVRLRNDLVPQYMLLVYHHIPGASEENK